MAPVPKDNKEKPTNQDGTEIDMFSNPNLAVTTGMSDSSDENDGDFDNVPSTAGYMLLSQEPGGEEEEEDEDDVDSGDDEMRSTGSAPEAVGRSYRSPGTIKPHDVDQMIHRLPDAVVQSETGTAGLTVSASSASCHPAFLAMFPDGKMPSYMQVPSVPSNSNSKEHLWNQKRQGKNLISMDSGQECTILRAMADFSLPKENVPEWARNLSEDQWKQQVVGKISPEERKVIWPNEMHKKAAAKKQNCQPTTTSSKTEANSDWVATFPDS